jgi:hypothetical protein
VRRTRQRVALVLGAILVLLFIGIWVGFISLK